MTSASFFSKRFKKNRKSINSTLSQYSLFEKKIELLHFKSIPSSIKNTGVSISISIGELAQMVERPLSMREVPGSTPGFSKDMAGVLVLLMQTCLFLGGFCFFFLSFGWFFIICVLLLSPLRDSCPSLLNHCTQETMT